MYHQGDIVSFFADSIKNGTFTISDTNQESSGDFYRLHLVVKDSKGLRDSAFVNILPKISILQLSSEPSGATIKLDGGVITTPYLDSSLAKSTRALEVPSPQIIDSSMYEFDHWAHGGNNSQSIIMGDNDTSFTAILRAVYSTSIIEFSTNLTINLFPNPDKNEISVTIYSEKKTDLILKIENTLGQILYKKEVKEISGEYHFVIDLATFTKGIYFIEVMNQKIRSFKIDTILRGFVLNLY